MTEPTLYRGHTIVERYAGEGQTFDVVTEHSNGMLGGTGSHGSRLAARAEIDGCMADRRLAWCRATQECARCSGPGAPAESFHAVCEPCAEQERGVEAYADYIRGLT